MDIAINAISGKQTELLIGAVYEAGDGMEAITILKDKPVGTEGVVSFTGLVGKRVGTLRRVDQHGYQQPEESSGRPSRVLWDGGRLDVKICLKETEQGGHSLRPGSTFEVSAGG